MTVYVVAWEYGPNGKEQGGGFDWYTTIKAMRLAFKEEQKNVAEMDDWRAFYFTVIVPNNTLANKITDFVADRVDANIQKLKTRNV